jgi:hypothetical protein
MRRSRKFQFIAHPDTELKSGTIILHTREPVFMIRLTIGEEYKGEIYKEYIYTNLKGEKVLCTLSVFNSSSNGGTMPDKSSFHLLLDRAWDYYSDYFNSKYENSIGNELNGKGYCCYCGVDLNLTIPAKEHLVPLSLGGNGSKKNVKNCCHSCNQERGSKPLKSWVDELEEQLPMLNEEDRNVTEIKIAKIKFWINYIVGAKDRLFMSIKDYHRHKKHLGIVQKE